MDYINYLGSVLFSLFIVVGPIDNGAIFGFLTRNYTFKDRNKTALKACMVAGVILLTFPLVGQKILLLLNIEFFALKIAGGILLLLLAIQIVLGESADEDALDSKHRNKDIAIFPLAIPLIAGPAAMTKTVDMFNDAPSVVHQIGFLAMVAAIITISYLLFLLGGTLVRLVGPKGADALARTLGIVLAAMSIDMIIVGLKTSGLLGKFLG